MPKFACSYAYDIACYQGFVVEAKTEKPRKPRTPTTHWMCCRP